ncbi:hypothetical protein ACWGJ2_37165 [Streptomyces sp. NPDC054796]
MASIKTKNGFAVDIYRDGDEVLVSCQACSRVVEVEAVENATEARHAVKVLAPYARRHAASCRKG